MTRRRCIALLACLSAAASPVWAAPTCTVASGALLSFGTVVPLASAGDITSNTGGSFWINCSVDVESAPALYSTGSRTMGNGAATLPFSLSAQSPNGVPLPATSPGSPVVLAHDGSNRTVTLHGAIRTADFKGLPAGAYTQSIWITVEY